MKYCVFFFCFFPSLLFCISFSDIESTTSDWTSRDTERIYTPSYTMKSVFLVSSNYSQLLWRNLIANRMRDELLFLNSFGFFFVFYSFYFFYECANGIFRFGDEAEIFHTLWHCVDKKADLFDLINWNNNAGILLFSFKNHCNTHSASSEKKNAIH